MDLEWSNFPCGHPVMRLNIKNPTHVSMDGVWWPGGCRVLHLLLGACKAATTKVVRGPLCLPFALQLKQVHMARNPWSNIGAVAAVCCHVG